MVNINDVISKKEIKAKYNFKIVEEKSSVRNGFKISRMNFTGIEITKYKSNDEIAIIPNEIEGQPILSIGKNAFKGSLVKEVYLPETLMSIGDRAFEDCSNLTSILIPHNTNTIGKMVFSGCPMLIIDCNNEWLKPLEKLSRSRIAVDIGYHIIDDAILFCSIYSYDIFAGEADLRPKYESNLMTAKIIGALFCLEPSKYPTKEQAGGQLMSAWSKIFLQAIETDRMKLVELLAPLVVTSKSINQYIEHARLNKKAECTVYLLNYQNEKFGTDGKTYRL